MLLARAGSAAASRESHLTSGDSARELTIGTPTKRLLRAYTTDEDDSEERGLSAKLPGLEKISNALKSSKTKELEGLLKAESVAGAFKTLKLSSMPIGKNDFIESKMVVKLFTSRNFKVWSNYATELNKKDPETAMFAALKDVFGEKNVATMIVLGKDSWSSNSVAKKLETAQFKSWYERGQRPDDVLKKMLGVNIREIKLHPREMKIWEDYTRYDLKRKIKY
ncbi:hypothetical protein PR002_g14946 [Phytophthora rubi]|nr:hypothetical protein PR002_g14946 [Phytophthora rubi]